MEQAVIRDEARVLVVLFCSMGLVFVLAGGGYLIFSVAVTKSL